MLILSLYVNEEQRFPLAVSGSSRFLRLHAINDFLEKYQERSGEELSFQDDYESSSFTILAASGELIRYVYRIEDIEEV